MDLRRVMGMLKPTENVSPAFDSYAILVQYWRGTGNPPTEQEVNDKWAEIEAEDAAIQYQKDREAEYAKQGITEAEMVDALWQKEVEGKPDEADALKTKKDAIDALYPKP